MTATGEDDTDGASQGSRPVILLVDDDDILRRMTARLLMIRCGADSLAAEDNASALDVLQHSHVDLIVQDQWRPGGTGIELLQVLKSNPSHSSIPVIVYTGADEGFPDVKKEALKEGAAAAFLKMSNTEPLCKEVRRLLDLPEKNDQG